MLSLVDRDDTLPIYVDDAKLFARTNSADAEDDLIESIIWTAVELMEQTTGKCPVETQWQEDLPCFPEFYLELKMSPVSEVEVEYYDASNALQTWDDSNYIVLNTGKLPCKITPIATVDFPSTYDRPDAVMITYTAGYESIPAIAMQTLRLLIVWLYDNRGQPEEQVSQAITSLLAAMEYRF